MSRRVICAALWGVSGMLCLVQETVKGAVREIVPVREEPIVEPALVLSHPIDKNLPNQVLLVAAENPNDLRIVDRNYITGFSLSMRYLRRWRRDPPATGENSPSARDFYAREDPEALAAARGLGLRNLEEVDLLVASWEGDFTKTNKFLLPQRALGYASLVFALASVPNYVANNLKVTTLEEIAEVLWTFSLFDLDPWISVPLASARSLASQSPTKWLCFKENLRDLILLSQEISTEVARILREVDQMHLREHLGLAAPLQTIPRDKIEWFFLTKEFRSIQWYLYTLLAPKVENLYIYAVFIDEAVKRNSVKLVLTASPVHKPSHLSLVQLVKRGYLPQVTALAVFVDTEVPVSKQVFASILELFPQRKTVTFSSLGNENFVHRNNHLVEVLANSELARVQHGYAPAVTGLVVNYAFALSGKALTYVERSSLKKFGFYGYYPPSYAASLIASAKKHSISLFIDRLLLGESPLARRLRCLVAPDSLFMAEVSAADALPALEAIEVHLRSNEWPHPVQPPTLGRFIARHRQVRALALVEHFPFLEAHAILMLQTFSSLPRLEMLDLSKTGLTLEFFRTRFVSALSAGYRHTLRTLYLPYAERLSRLPEDVNLVLLIIRHFPRLASLRLFFNASTRLARVLPRLMHDISAVLTTNHLSPTELASNLSFRYTQRADYPNSAEYVTSKFDFAKTDPQLAFSSAFTAYEANRSTYPEVLRVLSLSSRII